MEINVIKLKEYAGYCGVLYVEDDELIRTQTVEFLSRFFSAIDVAVDGEQGLEKYDETRHHIVITDINMPKMNGIEMIEKIRQKNEEQIILVTSAHNDTDNLMHLIELGIHRFVLKPFNFKQFIIMLYYIVEEIYIRAQNSRVAKLSKKIVDLTHNGVVVFDKLKIVLANKAFLEMGNFNNLETLLLEMPEVGVMFLPCTNCLEGMNNHDFLHSLQTLPESHHKVRIENKGLLREFQVHLSDLGDDNRAVIFTDITAIHDDLYLDAHTALPSRKALLEQMEIVGDQHPIIYTLLVGIKNYTSIVKYYRSSDAIGVEKEAAKMLKQIAKESLGESFVGYFGTSQFVVVSNKAFAKEIIVAIESTLIEYFNISSFKGTDLHLSYKAKATSFRGKAPLLQIEELLSNEFGLL